MKSQESIGAIINKGMHNPPNIKTSTCTIHGDFVSKNYFNDYWHGCPKCVEEMKEKENAEKEEKDRIEKQLQWEQKLGSSGIPYRFTNRTLSSYIAKIKQQEFALNFAIEYADKFDEVIETGRSAIFCGKPGTGKTHLSVGIGIEIMKKRYSVHFTTVQRMMRRIKEAWRKDSEESEVEVIKLYVSPSLLIVDEIGVQFGSEFERNTMFDILNSRYENKMPTLLLSNLTPSEVKIFLGERVFDRLREDDGKIIPFDWESNRGTQVKENDDENAK